MTQKIGAICCVNVDRSAFGVHLDAINMITSPQRYFFNDDFLRECFTKLGPWIVSCHLKDILLKQEYNPEMPFIIEHLVTDEEYIQSINYVQNLIK